MLHLGVKGLDDDGDDDKPLVWKCQTGSGLMAASNECEMVCNWSTIPSFSGAAENPQEKAADHQH